MRAKNWNTAANGGVHWIYSPRGFSDHEKQLSSQVTYHQTDLLMCSGTVENQVPSNERHSRHEPRQTALMFALIVVLCVLVIIVFDFRSRLPGIVSVKVTVPSGKYLQPKPCQ